MPFASKRSKALQTPGHPYRAALIAAYGKHLQVCTLDDVAQMAPPDWGRTAIVVVATIQSFRIEDADQRNVYSFSEGFEPHFKGAQAQGGGRDLQCLHGLPDTVVTAEDVVRDSTGVLQGFVGQPRWSLANWLALASYLRGDSVLQLGTIIGTCLFASRRPWRPPPALPPMRKFPLDRARVLQNPPDFVAAAAQRLRWAPWLVANIHLDGPLQDRPGAAPSWDNVLYQDGNAGGLGYVDAGHQRLSPLPAPTVLSYYQALGDRPDGRAQLAQQPWTHWQGAILATLAGPHPDIAQRTTRMDRTRCGHAMSIPVPGTQRFLSQIGLQRFPSKRWQLSNGERARFLPTPATARLAFAHSGWSGHSVFEEAFTRGHAAGLHMAA